MVASAIVTMLAVQYKPPPNVAVFPFMADFVMVIVLLVA